MRMFAWLSSCLSVIRLYCGKGQLILGNIFLSLNFIERINNEYYSTSLERLKL